MSTTLRKILIIARSHWLILINAVIMTLLIVSPAIVFPLMSGHDYRGINMPDDALFYEARAKELLEGNSLGNPYFREGKDGPEINHAYIQYILIKPLKWLGITSGQGLITASHLYNGVGIFLLILLLYVFVWQLAHNKLLGTTAALFAIGGYYFITGHNITDSLVTVDLNIYTRIGYPLWSSVPFFIFLNLLTKSLRNFKWKYVIATGVVFGGLFYVYFFCWSFALTLLGTLWIVTLIRRDYHGVKKITIIGTLGIAIGLYNLLSMYVLQSSAIGKQMIFIATINGFGRIPHLSGLTICFTILFIFFFLNKNDANTPLFASVILASFIVLNQQLITYQMTQDFHYTHYFIYPLTIIIGLYMVWSLAQSQRYQRILLVALLALVYINTAARQFRGILATFEFKNYAQQYRPIFDYLNNQEPSVVLASDLTYGDLNLTYTNSDIVWSNLANFLVFPVERLEDVLDIYYYLNRESRANFNDYIYKIKTGGYTIDNNPIYDFSSYKITPSDKTAEMLKLQQDSLLYKIFKYIAGYRVIFLSPNYGHEPLSIKWDGTISPSERQQVIDSLAKNFKDLSSNPTRIMDLLKKYRIHYIEWDTARQSEWDLKALPGLKEVLVSGNIHLYYLAY